MIHGAKRSSKTTPSFFIKNFPEKWQIIRIRKKSRQIAVRLNQVNERSGEKHLASSVRARVLVSKWQLLRGNRVGVFSSAFRKVQLVYCGLQLLLREVTFVNLVSSILGPDSDAIDCQSWPQLLLRLGYLLKREREFIVTSKERYRIIKN